MIPVLAVAEETDAEATAAEPATPVNKWKAWNVDTVIFEHIVVLVFEQKTCEQGMAVPKA
jgi:hypothetical protein